MTAKRKHPFIVCELSANHGGSLERAIATVQAVAASGADAIKLQTWSPDTMVLDKTLVVQEGPWKGWNMQELYRKAYTEWEWHEPIFKAAEEAGIEAFSSVFDLNALAFLESLDCPRYKISSFELVDLPLIEAVASTGKPMILSTGMADLGEIYEAVATARAAGCKSITLLKCTSAYPADPAGTNLSAMGFLERRLFPVRVGLSDHTQGIGVAVAASALGAKMIEKHVTLKREEGDLDAAFSLEPDELCMLVLEANRVRKVLGMAADAFKEKEEEAPQRALRRSLYFSCALSEGELIKAEHISTARPAAGLAPREASKVIGSIVTKDVFRGTPVDWSNVNKKAKPYGDFFKPKRAEEL